MTRTHQLTESVPNDPDRRNFRSSPIYRAYHARFADYALLCRFCAKQDHHALDGHARRAGERIKMGRELRRLADAAYRASFPQVQR